MLLYCMEVLEELSYSGVLFLLPKLLGRSWSCRHGWKFLLEHVYLWSLNLLQKLVWNNLELRCMEKDCSSVNFCCFNILLWLIVMLGAWIWKPWKLELAIQGGWEIDQHLTKGGCWNIARCWSELGRAIELGVYPTAESEASWTVWSTCCVLCVYPINCVQHAYVKLCLLHEVIPCACTILIIAGQPLVYGLHHRSAFRLFTFQHN